MFFARTRHPHATTAFHIGDTFARRSTSHTRDADGTSVAARLADSFSTGGGAPPPPRASDDASPRIHSPRLGMAAGAFPRNRSMWRRVSVLSVSIIVLAVVDARAQCRVEGVVRLADGAPLAAGTVRLDGLDYKQPLQTTTDAD